MVEVSSKLIKLEMICEKETQIELGTNLRELNKDSSDRDSFKKNVCN